AGEKSKTGRPWNAWFVLGTAINGRWETLGAPRPTTQPDAPEDADPRHGAAGTMPRTPPRTKARQRSRPRDIEKRQAQTAAYARIKELQTQNTQLALDLHRALGCRGCGCRVEAPDVRCPDCAARDFS